MDHSNYNEESIQSLDIISHIQKRPSAYIHDIGLHGQYATIREIIDNSLDELDECKRLNTSYQPILNVSIFYHPMNLNKYLVTIFDNGRGLPPKKLKDCFTKSMTSGKFDTNSYLTSSGLLGVGSKVPVALSDIFRADSFRNANLTTFLHSNIQHSEELISSDISNYLEKSNITSGTIVSFIISNKVYLEVNEFIHRGYHRILNLLKKLSLVNENYIIRFTLNTINKNINILMNDDHMVQYHLLNQIPYKFKCLYEFDSQLVNNRDELLLDILELNSSYKSCLSDCINISINLPKYRNIIKCDITIKIPNWKTKPLKDLLPIRIGLVNNLVLENASDYHFSILNEYLKNHISKLIENKSIRDFFLSSNYKLPLITIINLKYSGAQFVGTTKHAFKDLNFKSEYIEMLNNNQHLFKSVIDTIYFNIKEHLLIQYNKFTNKSISVVSNRKLLLDLNRPDKYCSCLSNDKSKNELFLVEGDSAKSVKGRDKYIQALYTLGGKPCNAVLELGKEQQTIETLMNNRIFSDIIKLLNIKPNDPNLDSLRFNKIFIMSDADTHGYHIASIIASNLMVYNKYLITNGHLYIVIPPLYSLRFKKSKPNLKTPTLYIRSKKELIYTLCNYIYQEVFDIYVEKNDKMIKLPFEAYVSFIQMVFDISEELKNISEVLNIPLILVEALAMVIDVLSKISLTKEDIEYISKVLNTDVIYDSKDQILIVPIGIKDYVIPLVNFNSIYQKEVYPLLKQLDWFNINLYIQLTNKKEMIPISIIQLYELCNSFSNLYEVERYKGVGSMPPKDRQISCLDPNTRITYRINDIGDIDVVYGMLGINSTYRKMKLINDI